MSLSRLDKAQRFGLMLASARIDAGATQKTMAKALGRSVATIQNWEAGIGCPDYIELEDWFTALGLNMSRYILNYKYPDTFTKIDGSCPIKDIDKALDKYLSLASDTFKRQLAFILMGRTGSDPIQQINMLVAHNHTTIRSRSNVAQLVYDNYLYEESRNELICKDNVPPDIEALRQAKNAGKQSAKEGKLGYHLQSHKPMFIEEHIKMNTGSNSNATGNNTIDNTSETNNPIEQ